MILIQWLSFNHDQKILVPLPEPEARQAMFEELLPSQPNEDQIPYDVLVEQTEGYSGSDIRLLCKEAAMQPLRRVMSQLEQRQEVVPDEGMWLLAFRNYMQFSYFPKFV